MLGVTQQGKWLNQSVSVLSSPGGMCWHYKQFISRSRESRLKPKVKILPLSHSQHRSISQSSLFPNIRRGQNPNGSAQGTTGGAWEGCSPIVTAHPRLIPSRIREKDCVSRASALSSERMRVPDRHYLNLPPPHNTQMHSHTEANTTSHL